MRRTPRFALFTALFFFVGFVQANRRDDLLLQARVFIYRPDVFADFPFGFLPKDPQIPIPGLWYMKIQATTITLYGAKAFKEWLWNRQIPGLDFTGDTHLMDQTLDILFHRAGPSTYRLKLLRLRGTPTSDESLITIGQWTDLEVLELGEHVTDRGMAHLSTLHNLRHLVLRQTHISDEGLPALHDLHRLERLDLRDTQATAKGLEALTELSLLELQLGPAMQDSAMAPITKIKTLNHLDLSETKISSKGLALLPTLRRLHTLFLGPGTTDDALPFVARLETLRRLDLTGAAVTDSGVAKLAALTNLEELALGRTPVTDKIVKALTAFSHLRYLEVSDTAVTPEGLALLANSSTLEVISLSTKRMITPEEILPFGKCPRLRTVIINGIPLSKDLMIFLKTKAAGRTRLEEWILPWAEAAAVSDQDLSNALEVASLSPEKTGEKFSGFHSEGLVRIHETEADLNDVIAPPPAITQDSDVYSEKNFLGEINVQAGSSKSKK